MKVFLWDHHLRETNLIGTLVSSIRFWRKFFYNTRTIKSTGESLTNILPSSTNNLNLFMVAHCEYNDERNCICCSIIETKQKGFLPTSWFDLELQNSNIVLFGCNTFDLIEPYNLASTGSDIICFECEVEFLITDIIRQLLFDIGCSFAMSNGLTENITNNMILCYSNAIESLSVRYDPTLGDRVNLIKLLEQKRKIRAISFPHLR